MSYMKTLIRSSLESADAEADLPAVNSDPVVGDQLDPEISTAMTLAAHQQGEIDDLEASVESHFVAVGSLLSIADSLESLTPVAVPHVQGALCASLESALVSVATPQFTDAMVQEVKESIQADASHSQDAAKSVQSKAREIFQRLVDFLKGLWRKFAQMMSNIFNAIVGVKTRVKRFNERVAKRDLSVTPKDANLPIDKDNHKSIYASLYWKDTFTSQAAGLVDALSKVQTAVNTLDTTFTDRYEADMNRLEQGFDTKDPAWIKEMANGQIPLPAGFSEIKSDTENGRLWVTGPLPGGNVMQFQQTVVSVGKFKAAGYDIRVLHREPKSYPDSIPAMDPRDMTQIGDKILKILEDSKHGKELVTKAAQTTERSARRPPINPTALSLHTLFHNRYRCVTKLSMRLNALILKTALATLAWGDASLALYPNKG